VHVRRDIEVRARGQGKAVVALPDPEDLYTLDADLPELASPVMLYSLDGFIDAGAP
jgi:hypothetical protein